MVLKVKNISTLFLAVFIGVLTSVSAMAQDSTKTDSGLKKAYKDYRSVKTVEQKEQKLKSMLDAYPPDQTKGAKQIYENLYADLAVSWLGKNNQEKYATYQNEADKPQLYKRLFGMVRRWSSKKEHLDLAKQYGQQVIAYYAKQKSSYAPYYHASALETNGQVLLALGEPEEALKSYKEAYTFYIQKDRVSLDFLIRYATLLAKQNHNGEAMNVLASSVLKGKSNNKITDELEQQYKQTRGTTEGYKVYLEAMQEVARQHIYSEVHDQKLKDTKSAPAFTLQNLDGQQVSLNDMRGKVVIVDFWATWCGPCKASFPGMQMVVNKYAHDPDVAFLFVDTWEDKTGSDTPQKDVEAFIEKKGYSFEVLLDAKNSVVKDFEVRGIPTKFVIGPSGHIQFKVVGSNGISAEEVTKVNAMIEIIKKEG